MEINQIKSNLTSIEQKITQAAEISGREREDIKLIAVSKTKPNELIEAAYALNLRDFGENKPQEAKQKATDLQNLGEINWHIIGSLQTNKVKFITPFCSLLHSLDRLSLAEALQKRLEFEGKNLDCLIQINISGEDSKSGILPNETDEFIAQLKNFGRIKIKGLMTIAENTGDEQNIRDNFKQMKNIFDRAKGQQNSSFEMKYLSMGMSSDYEIAIEEGANMVRIGSSIFGLR